MFSGRSVFSYVGDTNTRVFQGFVRLDKTPVLSPNENSSSSFNLTVLPRRLLNATRKRIIEPPGKTQKKHF